jgi:hypothetical protein
VHIIITDAWLARRQALHLNGWKLIGSAAPGMDPAARGCRGHLPLGVSRRHPPGLARLQFLGRAVITGDTEGERDAYLRANLDAMARKLGEMQARMMQIDSLGERVAGWRGWSPTQARPPLPGSGGVLVGEPLPDAGGTHERGGCRSTRAPGPGGLAHGDRIPAVRSEDPAHAGAHREARGGCSGRLVPSASGSTRSPVSLRCTPDWISRPTQGTPILAAAGGCRDRAGIPPRLRQPGRGGPRQRPRHPLCPCLQGACAQG